MASLVGAVAGTAAGAGGRGVGIRIIGSEQVKTQPYPPPNRPTEKFPYIPCCWVLVRLGLPQKVKKVYLMLG